MSEAKIMAAKMRADYQKIAKQVRALGEGLQNAAPSGSSASVDYLLAIAEKLEGISQECQNTIDDNSFRPPKP